MFRQHHERTGKVCLQEVRLTSICRNRCPHASPGRLRTSGFSQARLLLLYFHCFYAGARSLLSVRFELSLQGIPHCFCTDLGEPDVAGKVREDMAGYQQLDGWCHEV